MNQLPTLIFFSFLNVLLFLIPSSSQAANNNSAPGFIKTPTSNPWVSYLNSMSAFQIDAVKTQGAPSPRGGHTSVVIGDSMYVFGGCYLDTRCYNEVYAYNVMWVIRLTSVKIPGNRLQFQPKLYFQNREKATLQLLLVISL